MSIARGNLAMGISSRSKRLKECVIAAFSEPAPSIRARLGEFSLSEWRRAMYWLDISGLALYFFDRITQIGLGNCLPDPILTRLRQNLTDNRERAESLFDDAVAISLALQHNNISFALLKGITLPFESVPDSVLRSQIDLDFLIRDSDATAAQRCLEDLGYALDAVSGRTWEFKAGVSGTATLKDLYKVRSERSVELHLLPNACEGTAPGQQDRLTRAQLRSFHGIPLPVLSPADLFVQQALHLFKHLCGERTRASWVLEFWRHVSSRRGDAAFWREVESIAETEPRADIAIGAATLLTTLTFGPFAPEELSRWSMDRLSPAICLWLQLYGRRVLLSDSLGHKFYLLLRQQLFPDSVTERAERRRLILPIHWPQRITRATADERPFSRMMRYCAQVSFVMLRLRFHTAEGLRYIVESLRWHRRLTRVAQ